MTESEVKQIVTDTVNVLLGGNMIKYSDVIIYERMGDRLREHYKKPDPLISEGLKKLEDHPYYDVLELYYRNNLTLEVLAEEFDVDISTIVRNKKYLCVKLFKLIN